MAAVPGRNYAVLISTNLVYWNLLVQTNAATDAFTFQETQTGQFPRRFYRVLEQW